MRFRLSTRVWSLLALALGLACSSAKAGELTRAEVIATAQSFAAYQWKASAANARKGPDSSGIEIVTPSAGSADDAKPGYWIVGQTNTGVPYKWGGFDSLTTFAAGIRGGKAAGDLYNAGK